MSPTLGFLDNVPRKEYHNLDLGILGPFNHPQSVEMLTSKPEILEGHMIKIDTKISLLDVPPWEALNSSLYICHTLA